MNIEEMKKYYCPIIKEKCKANECMFCLTDNPDSDEVYFCKTTSYEFGER